MAGGPHRWEEHRSHGLQVGWGSGAIIVVGGLLVMSGGLSRLGRLPGDIRIERENVKVYIPIVSMLLVSLLLSAVIWVIRRLG